jgi:hypothetical protein
MILSRGEILRCAQDDGMDVHNSAVVLLLGRHAERSEASKSGIFFLAEGMRVQMRGTLR